MNTFARIALLSLALATTGVVSEASAQSPLFQWLRLMPVNGGQHHDLNRNGRVDIIFYDVSRNGRIDAVRMDSNSDGWLDVVALDTNGDGVFDEIFRDTNRDGVLNALVKRFPNGQSYAAHDLQGYGYFSGWTASANGNTQNSQAMQAVMPLITRPMYDRLYQSQRALSRIQNW
jgi:hypothetical protein